MSNLRWQVIFEELIKRFNIMILFFRVLGFLYGKFLSHLLLNLLLLPR